MSFCGPLIVLLESGNGIGCLSANSKPKLIYIRASNTGQKSNSLMLNYVSLPIKISVPIHDSTPTFKEKPTQIRMCEWALCQGALASKTGS